MCGSDYTGKQLKIINGEIPIEEVDGRVLFWFHKKAIANGDLELAQRIKTQLEALKEQRMPSNKYTDEQLSIISGKSPLELAGVRTLQNLYNKAIKNGDFELANKVESQLDILRARYSNPNEYTKNQLKIISGETAIKNTNRQQLCRIYSKAIKKGDLELAQKIETQLDSLGNNHHDPTEYTSRQLKIINGEISFDCVNVCELNRLVKKLTFHNENELAETIKDFIQQRRELREFVETNSKDYSSLHKRIIRGEIPLEDIDERVIIQIYNRAIAHGDLELSQKIKIYLDYSIWNSQECKVQFEGKRIRLNEIINWKQPQTNEYTERQKNIIKNEIPLTDVHTNELIKIYTKSHNIGDYELSERILDIINERREIEREIRSKTNKVYKKIPATPPLIYNTDSSLTPTEQELMNGYRHWDDYTVPEIQKIISKSEVAEDTKNLAIAKEMLFYKQNPMAKYKIRNHKNAINVLELLLGFPIRRPETWFVDQ